MIYSNRNTIASDEKMFFGKKFSGYQKGSLSGLDILVLSIIINNETGITGYEIINEINKTFKNLWKASAGTIYPLLNRLAEKNYLEVEEVEENNRQKKIYRISDIGKERVKNILENNLIPSIDTLSDYIQTIIKAIPMPNIESKMFSCFPFRHVPHEVDIDESDYSLENIRRIQKHINRLTHSKEALKSRQVAMENQIEHLEDQIKKLGELLDHIREKREKTAKTIEIVEDDDEFEDF